MVDAIGNLVLYRTRSKEIIKNRREFYAMRKKRGETAEKWLIRVRTHADCCEFMAFTEYLLIDKFICGLNNDEIESIQNEDTWTLNLLNECFVKRPDDTAVIASISKQNQMVSFDVVKCESVEYEYCEIDHNDEVDEDQENITVEQQPDIIDETDPFTEPTLIHTNEKSTLLEADLDPCHEIPIDVVKSEFESGNHDSIDPIREVNIQHQYSCKSKPNSNGITLLAESQNSNGILDIRPETVQPHEESIDCAKISKSYSTVKAMDQLICELCGKLFANSIRLSKHKKNIHRSYSCIFCNEIFSTSIDLKKHLKTHRIHCNLCDKSTTCLPDLLKHKKMVHKQNYSYACVFCSKIFETLVDLKRHSKSHVQKKPHDCNLCDKSFALLTGLLNHERVAHKRKHSFVCIFCRKTFTKIIMLKQHVKLHIRKRSMVCELCDSTFFRSGDLKTHRLLVHQQKGRIHKSGTCNECGKTFKIKYNLKKHLRTHTGEKQFACDLCDKSFAQSGNLKTHKRTHHQRIRPHKCDECGKGFIASSHLRDHMFTHTKQSRPYACDLCNTTFLTAFSLGKHKEYHNKINECRSENRTLIKRNPRTNVPKIKKVHICDLCNKTFINKTNLERHKDVVHDGIRLFTCDVCDKRFPTYTHIKVHMNSHIGLTEQHACNLCDRSFTQKDNLKRHKKVVHAGIRPHACEVCDWRFAQSSDLRNHMKTHSGNARKRSRRK